MEYRKEGSSYADELEAKIYGTGLIIYRVNTELNTNFTGPKDYIYVFRPEETGEGHGAGDLTKSFLSEESGRTTYGIADMSADITKGAITYSSGLNSGIVISNVSSAKGDTISFHVEIPDLSDNGLWDVLGDGPVNTIESNQASMDVVGNEVYVTYSEGYGTKELKAAKFDGSSWSSLGSGLPKEGYDGKIRVYNGVPYIIYHGYDKNSNYKLHVAKLENGVWNTFQTISDGDCQFSDIVSTPNGLYIAHTDSGAQVLKVKKLNEATNSFEQVGSDIGNGYIYGISLAEDNGKVYVSYSNFDEGDKIYVKAYNEGIWSDLGSLNATEKATNIVAKSGKVYLALGGNEISVYELASGVFTKIGGSIAGSEGLYPKLQVVEDQVYLAYLDYNTGEIKLKFHKEGQWIQEGYRVSEKKGNSVNFIVEDGIGYISYLDKDGMVEVRTRKLKDSVIDPDQNPDKDPDQDVKPDPEPDPEVKPDPVYEPEDIDKNGVIDLKDIELISLKYNVTNNDDDWDSNLDFNGDGIIDLYDIIKVSKKITN